VLRDIEGLEITSDLRRSWFREMQSRRDRNARQPSALTYRAVLSDRARSWRLGGLLSSLTPGRPCAASYSSARRRLAPASIANDRRNENGPRRGALEPSCSLSLTTGWIVGEIGSTESIPGPPIRSNRPGPVQIKSPAAEKKATGQFTMRTTISTGMLARKLSRASDLSLTNVRTAPAGYTEAVCCSLLAPRPTGVRDRRRRVDA
jgi:hypothetical protein